MLADQHRLRRRLRALTDQRTGPRAQDPAAMDGLVAEIDASIARRQRRAERRPVPRYPSDLPVARQRDEIAAAIRDHPVVILCGETGSGKTTQLPKICLELGRGVAGLIGHTQPRRIAARSVAARIAQELESPLGPDVGYTVRFTDRTSPDAYIKLMTDGILLAETRRDRMLMQYDTIILDEAHERSLNIDFLLGYLKHLLPRRPDLKLIITSATIDPARFSDHFDAAPVIEVAGRTYPVEIRWRPVEAEEADEEDPTLLEAILGAIDEALAAGPGDLLVFLSGEREIREAAEAIRKHRVPEPVSVLPLYARLSADEQNRVFERHETRRIVLATNVAETSLTVPGIRFVIDPGYARISRYSANARVQRLPIEPVSQASANQRAGRCGRIGPGVCIRLYSEEDYHARRPFTDPEILRANLASVILQMKYLRLGDVEQFPFIDPPRAAMVRDGHQALLELGAVDDAGALTTIGRQLARMPIDPRLGRMILAARDEGSLREVLIIASALATQDPRLRPMESAHEADRAHRPFLDERSDFLAFLAIWDFYHQQAEQLSSGGLRRLCREKYLSYLRLREWHDVHRQLAAMARAAGMVEQREPASYESIHRALLAGLLGNIGCRAEGHQYRGPHDRTFHVFPGSVLFRNGPAWIMSAELVETNRLYARTVARIHPDWIERLAAHLVKRTCGAPWWNARSGHVEAFERVTLHGLTIVPKRRVHFGAVDLRLAREVFIQQALVEGEYQPAARRQAGEPAFLQHNRRLMSEARALEAKLRRRGVVADADHLAAFYDHRLPPDVNNAPAFEKWRRREERSNPDLLFMTRADVIQPEWRDFDGRGFPDAIIHGGRTLPLDYRHEPGDAVDGVSVRVPLEALSTISAARLEWLVPGLLREKITAMIRALPKDLRVNFVPAPEFAARCEPLLRFGEGLLREALSGAMARVGGAAVPPQAWRTEGLPDHLRMNVIVVDASGSALASGRDLEELRARLADRAAAALAAPLDWDRARNGIVDWDFGDLPLTVETGRGDGAATAFPALVDDGASAALRLLRSEPLARQATRAGLRRLFALAAGDAVAAHVEYLPNFAAMCASFVPLGSEADLRRDLVDLIVDRAFIGDDPDIRDEASFRRRIELGTDRLWAVAADVASRVAKLLDAFREADLQLALADSPAWARAAADIRRQLSALVFRGFLTETPWEWLIHAPRYLRAIVVRLHRLANAGLDRDQRNTDEIERHLERYAAAADRARRAGAVDPALERYRWLIEELRVSLFAQELGTAVPVSPKRLDRQWASIGPA